MKLREDGLKFPIYHAVIVMLFAVGLVSLPYEKIFESLIADEVIRYYISQSLPRLIVSVVAVVLIVKYKFTAPFKNFSKKGIVVAIVSLIVCVNNFPIIGVITGNVKIIANLGQILSFILYCLSIGVFEEIVFRGIVFPLCYIKLKDKKHGLFFSVALSSALFGLIHLVNLFGGMGIGACILQVGYSFLIGAMCAISLIYTKNIFIAILLHAVYDVGGTLLRATGESAIAFGVQWDVATIIITAVLGVICAIYLLIKLLRADDSWLKKAYLESEQVESEGDKA